MYSTLNKLTHRILHMLNRLTLQILLESAIQHYFNDFINFLLKFAYGCQKFYNFAPRDSKPSV